MDQSNTPNYDELNKHHINLFKLFGEMDHYLDEEYHPRLSREEVVRIMAEIHETAKQMTLPIINLLHREIEAGVWKPEHNNECKLDKYDGVPADTHSV